jgi:tetratricopeptide (TPR) repeat protein
VRRSGVTDDASITDASCAPEASALVARGWAHLRSGSFFELSDAASAFQAATVIDPTDAAAHAGMALVRAAQATVHDMPLVEAFGEAKAAALRALALDHESADAQVALGQVMFLGDWDWIAAERSFQRALAINPNHAEAYLHYGGLVEALGELDRGFQLKRQGLDCDSTSALAHVLIAVSFWNQRRYDDVIVWANKALDRDPRHLFARELRGGAYWKMGDLERALSEDLQRAEAHSPNEETLAAIKGMLAEIDPQFKERLTARQTRLEVAAAAQAVAAKDARDKARAEAKAAAQAAAEAKPAGRSSAKQHPKPSEKPAPAPPADAAKSKDKESFRSKPAAPPAKKKDEPPAADKESRRSPAKGLARKKPR